MILYHGSSITVENPIIIKNEHGKDFGHGFYTTSILEQSKKWAVRKTMIEKLSDKNAKAIVSVYDFDETAIDKLNTKKFTGSNIDWLEFVCNCRSNANYKHSYDIVSGKIADDNVGETVSFVVNGIMRKEDALERLKFERINDQICFCSEISLSFLKYIKREVL